MPRFIRPAVFKYHGLLVGLGCHLFLTLRFLSPWNLIHSLAKRTEYEWVVDRGTGKGTPIWQDIVVLIGVGITALSVLAVQHPHTEYGCLYVAALVAGGLHLFGILVYQINVMFFDDLVAEDPRVMSIRRVFFHAAVNLAETVMLFAALYLLYGGANGFEDGLRWSIQGLTLNVPVEWSNKLEGHHAKIWSFQIAVSLFFIVILLATLASQVFRRKEIAPWPLPPG